MSHSNSHLLKQNALRSAATFANLGSSQRSIASLSLHSHSPFRSLANFRSRASQSGLQHGAIGNISANQQINGRLSQTDNANSQRRDRYADDYALSGLSVGQRVRVDLSSPEFDAYLQIINARTGAVLHKNDDIDVLNKNASLAFTVQAGVQYRIRVTSFEADETGRYRLSTRSATSSAPVSLFSRDAGYGLVDAAKAVAQAAARNPFGNVPNLGGNQWQLDTLNVPEVWAQGFTGQGITVAVLDTGLDYNHSDLQGNLWQNPGEVADNGLDDDGNGFVDDVRGWNFVDTDSNDPRDVRKHGTHVAGTIAAVNNGFGATGVAPSAKIMPVRVIGGADDRNDNRFDANVAAGIRYAVQNGARVINLSLGNYLGDPPMRQTKAALKVAQRAGVVAVMASGNERESGANRPIQPADFARNGLGIAVGAVDRRRRVASFSNPAGNQRLNFVMAPGVDVRSTLPEGQYSPGWNGTSMATAYVSGVVALMLSANPNLTATQVAAILTKTAAAIGN